MVIRCVRPLLLFSTIFYLPTAVQSQSDEKYNRAVTANVLENVIRDDGFSGAVLVAKGDEVILRAASGYASREKHMENVPTTRFPIESLTKQFTATAVLMLVQEHRMALTDPIAMYYPTVPRDLADVTVAQLLEHSSGIVDCKDCGDASFSNYREYVERSLQISPAFKPGNDMLYSNAGYGLLAAAIEKVTRQSYGQYIRDRIFARLKMKNTDIGVTTDQVADGYVCKNANSCNQGTGANLEKMAGFNGIYSTIDDMLIWARSLQRGTLLDHNSLAEMFRDYGHGYGFGWYLTRKFGHNLQWHTGNDGNAGYASIIDLFPDDSITIIVLTNQTGYTRGNTTLTIDGKDVTFPASPARKIVDGIEDLYFAHSEKK